MGLISLLFISRVSVADVTECPGADDPPPPILEVNQSELIHSLEVLKDTQGRLIWKTTEEAKKELSHIFESVPRKTKLEQFFQLLYLIQQQVPPVNLPVEVKPPGITALLLAAKVFKDPSFPKNILSVRLFNDRQGKTFYQVQFPKEVRFAINEGQGFSTWDQGMCQIAKKLVFYPGFSFHLRKGKNTNNLIVDLFNKVQIYGQFGTRRILKIDLEYVDLEKVEFIEGTDQGRVKARVAEREFKENPHSRLFRYVGRLIPNTAKQRIDW